MKSLFMLFIIICNSLIFGLNADFEADITEGIIPLEVHFSDISSDRNSRDITSWEWDFENDGIIDSYQQNPSFTYTEEGYFSVSLTIGDGSYYDSEIKYDYIATGEAPEADFEADITVGLQPLEVSFSDLSTGGLPGGDREIISWEWDFDNDGNIDSYEQYPYFIYNEVGIFTVSLTSGDGTNFDTEIKPDFITVEEELVADFEANITEGLLPVDIQFTDLSSGGLSRNGREVTSWEWDFDDDGEIDSYQQNPVFIYEEEGFFTVSLTVGDGTNYDTEIKYDYIIIGDQLIADFEAEPTEGILPLEVNFSDLSTGGLPETFRDIITWEWDFDDDGEIDSYEQYPYFIYDYSGVYNVSLTVSDGANFASEIKQNYITVAEPIIPDFYADSNEGFAPLEVQFTDLSSGGLPQVGREIISWEWDFDDNSVIDSYEQNPSFTYLDFGEFTVTLTVSDGTNSESISEYDLINVMEPVTANFEADPTLGLYPLTVQFTDLSSGGYSPNREITSWEWDFNNDGITDSYYQYPEFTFNLFGTYSIGLTVSDGTNYDTLIRENYITVTDSVLADFAADVTTGNAPLEVNFTDLTSGNPTSWLWDFDNDGFIDSNEQNPNFVYTDQGMYTVSLISADNVSESTEIKEGYISVDLAGSQDDIASLKTQLMGSYPNPFNPSTTISFSVSGKDAKDAKIEIYNVKGQKIRTFPNIQITQSANQQIVWDGSDSFGKGVSSGLYVIHLKVNNKTVSLLKCELLK